ncbi:conserved hypothetical protein [Pseudomonas sp. P15-2025]
MLLITRSGKRDQRFPGSLSECENFGVCVRSNPHFSYPLAPPEPNKK